MLAVAALLLLLALISYNPHDPSLNTATSRRPTNLVGMARRNRRGPAAAELRDRRAAAGPGPRRLVMAADEQSPRAAAHARDRDAVGAARRRCPAGGDPARGRGVAGRGGLGGAIGGMLATGLLGMGAGLLGPAGAPVVLAVLATLALVLVLLALGLTGREWRATVHGVRRGGQDLGPRRPPRRRISRAHQPALQPPPRAGRRVATRAGSRAAQDPPALAPFPPPPVAADDIEIPAPEAFRPKVAAPARKPAPAQPSLPLPENGWQFPPLALLKPAPPRAESGPSEEALQAERAPARDRAVATTACRAPSARSGPARWSRSTSSSPRPASAAPG